MDASTISLLIHRCISVVEYPCLLRRRKIDRRSICGLMETAEATDNPGEAARAVSLSGFRVALCSPTNENPKARHASSLGIRSLSSFLRKQGAITKVVDAHCWGLTASETAESLVDFQPDLVGIQLIFFRQIYGLQEVIEACQDRFPYLLNKTWVVGGHVPTFSPQQLLSRFPQFDLAIRGEGEKALSTLCETLTELPLARNWRLSVPNASYIADGEYRSNSATDLIPDLDTLPFPDVEALDLEHDGPASIMGSRGCYATCEFCSVPPFFKEAKGPLWRLRSASSIVDEIEALSKLHGYTHISFLDDIFLGTDSRSKKRALEIARLIQKRELSIKFSIECRADSVELEIFHNLKQAGLARVFLGLESGSERVLARYKKMSGVSENDRAIAILNQIKVDIGVGFIMFNPETTLSEFEENVEYLAKHNILTYRAISNKMQAYPGTPVHQRLRATKRLFGDDLYPDYEFDDVRCSELLAVIRDEMDELDKIDVHLLRLEFRSANDEKRRAKLADYKTAYSSDLSKLVKNVAQFVRLGDGHPKIPIGLEVDEIITQWENGRYGSKN